MRKLFDYFEGGLGDVITQYLDNDHIAGLSEYKASTPTYAKAIINVHNPQAVELLRYSPFDEIQCLDYHPELRSQFYSQVEGDGFVPVADFVTPTPTPPPIYLSDADKAYLDCVLPQERYIAFHPGAGKADYKMDGRVDFPLLLDAAEKAGFKVVMIGGTSSRVRDIIVESPTIQHPSLINMVGTANPRLCLEIIRRASGMIGTLSAYVISANYFSVPSLCFTVPEAECFYIQKLRRTGASIIRFPQIERSAVFYDAVIGQCTSKP